MSLAGSVPSDDTSLNVRFRVWGGCGVQELVGNCGGTDNGRGGILAGGLDPGLPGGLWCWKPDGGGSRCGIGTLCAEGAGRDGVNEGGVGCERGAWDTMRPCVIEGDGGS